MNEPMLKRVKKLEDAILGRADEKPFGMELVFCGAEDGRPTGIVSRLMLPGVGSVGESTPGGGTR